MLPRPGASAPRAAAPPRRPDRRPEAPIPWRALLAWPVGLSVAVTLLRLVGELRGWSPAHFSRLPGGGLATVGITWLIPFVGLFVGWKLGRAGHRPESWARAVWQPLGALAVAWTVAAALGRLAHTGWTANFLLWAVASLAAVAIAYLAWPAAGAALLAYAGAVRGFVAAVMAVAIARGWGTHYDAVPPGFPHMERMPRFLLLGLLPQATIWVGLTVAIGVACAVLGHRAATRFGVGRAG